MNNNLNYSQGWRSKLLADKSIFFLSTVPKLPIKKKEKIDAVDKKCANNIIL